MNVEWIVVPPGHHQFASGNNTDNYEKNILIQRIRHACLRFATGR
jgi:hypothetical protein